ncbi:MAG: Pectinesterase [Gaiellaceae bacterium]|jgi:hypothetical protein|nr:Pectinesterase [Gaiellaceae bacterium]
MAKQSLMHREHWKAIAQFGDPEEKQSVAGQQAANTVEVDPGGASFPTIGAAIASIEDNSLRKQYLLSVGPGTYKEQVTLKPYVQLQGAGPDQTTITFPPTADSFSRGTVIAASNSSVADMTVSCLGGSWGDNSTALLIAGCDPFYASNVALLSDDEGNAGVNSETVAVNWNAEPVAQAQVYISYATMGSNLHTNDAAAVGMIVNGPANAELIEVKVTATGGAQSFGVQSNGGAVVNLANCFVQGASFALTIPDDASTLIATNCQIDGPVGNGVQLVVNPPPAEAAG